MSNFVRHQRETIVGWGRMHDQIAEYHADAIVAEDWERLYERTSVPLVIEDVFAAWWQENEHLFNLSAANQYRRIDQKFEVFRRKSLRLWYGFSNRRKDVVTARIDFILRSMFDSTWPNYEKPRFNRKYVETHSRRPIMEPQPATRTGSEQD